MGLGVLRSLNLAEDKIHRNRSSLGRVLHRWSHQDYIMELDSDDTDLRGWFELFEESKNSLKAV